MTRPHEPIRTRYADDAAKHDFVRGMFDRAARHYDRIGAVGFLGTGHAHRKRAVLQAGLQPGMAALDVACGTGAVTRAILEVLDGTGRVCGVDPSEGMLSEARKTLGAEFRIGHAEELPFDNESFDFLSMGYALRHVADLDRAFAEFRRVLKAGGRLLILEISRPRARAGLLLARLYFRDFLPFLSWAVTGSRDARDMMAYYWETIEGCVPPDTILAALRAAGFKEAGHRVTMGIFSAYQAKR